MNLKQVSLALAAQGHQHVLVVASHGTNTKQFLDSLDSRTRAEILDNIAKQYGITRDAAYAEVTDAEAESLLDYVTGPQRAATSLLMKRKGVTAGQSVVAELSDSDVVTVELRGSRDGIGNTFKAYCEDPYTGKPESHPIEGKVVVTHWRKGPEQEGTFKIKEGKAIHFIRIETFDSRGSQISLHTKKRNPWKIVGGSGAIASEAIAGASLGTVPELSEWRKDSYRSKYSCSPVPGLDLEIDIADQKGSNHQLKYWIRVYVSGGLGLRIDSRSGILKADSATYDLMTELDQGRHIVKPKLFATPEAAVKTAKAFVKWLETRLPKEATAGVDVRKLETSLVGALKEFRAQAQKFADTEHDAQAREDWETVLKRKRDRINDIVASILSVTEKDVPEIERPTINIAQNCLNVALTSIYADQPGVAASVARAIKVTRDQIKSDIAGLTHATDYREAFADIDYIAGKITVMTSYIEKVANEAG